jgi:hypothetical protein
MRKIHYFDFDYLYRLVYRIALLVYFFTLVIDLKFTGRIITQRCRSIYR